VCTHARTHAPTHIVCVIADLSTAPLSCINHIRIINNLLIILINTISMQLRFPWTFSSYRFSSLKRQVSLCKWLRWSRGSVLAFGTQVRRFAPGPRPRIFRAKKILSKPSFGGEVKPSVPCRSFTACKRSLTVTWKTAFRQNSRTVLAHSSTFRRWVLSLDDTRGDAWWQKLERLTKIAQ
jgi:hypothetical protein